MGASGPRRALILAAIALGLAAPAAGQSSPPLAALTRADVSFLWGFLDSGDARFAYDSRIIGDIDVVSYGPLRFTFRADYEAVIGHERRLFDLNTGNYSIDGVITYRLGKTDLQAEFHHVSRHLVDRENLHAISWNVAGGRVERLFQISPATTLGTAFEYGRVTRPAFVDYVWTSNVHFDARYRLDPHTALYGVAEGGLIGVNRAILNRDRQCGARFEGGLHLNNHHGSVQFFAGYERRIDGYPTGRTRVRFLTFGFRISSR